MQRYETTGRVYKYHWEVQRTYVLGNIMGINEVIGTPKRMNGKMNE